LTEWEAYEKVSGPLGPERFDLLFADLASVIANAQRAKSQRPYRPDQFMRKWDPDAPPPRNPEMDGEEMLRAVKKLHRGMARERKGGTGGDDQRSHDPDRDRH
jgi:hypothetical protein